MATFPTDHGDRNVWGPKLYNWLTVSMNSDGTLKKFPVTVTILVVDNLTTITTGDGKEFLFIPDNLAGLNLIGVRAFVSTVSSSGIVRCNVRNVTDGVDMLTTRVSIDANEKTSVTAATAAVIDTTHDDVALGDEIAIDIDDAGTGAKGLQVALTFG